MDRFLAWSLILVGVWLIGYMIRQAVTGKRPLLSIRNMFFLGVLIFQISSAALSYFYEHYGELPLGDPVGTGIKFLLILGTFLILFNIAYERGWCTFGIQNRVKVKVPIPGTGALIIVSLACLGTAALLRFALGQIPLIGILAEIGGGAMASMAAGTAAWLWAQKARNPLLLAFAVVIIAASSALMMVDTFGRRGMVSVVVAALWGAYHGGFRHVNLRRAAVPLVVLGLGGFALVAAFTSVRGEEGKGTNLAEVLRRLPEADIGKGALALLTGQDAGPNSMWVIENRPEPYPYQPLESLIYFVVHPIPRTMWEGKPIGLGTLMVTQSLVQGKGDEYSVGPGLVGHIVNDNPWIALPLYAVLLAALVRIMDDLLKRFPNHPYVVIPLGIELGEIIGMPRGELGFFLFRAVMGMIFAYYGTLILAKALNAMGFSARHMEQPAPELEEAGEYEHAAPAITDYQ
jgi:hypothetical protein